MCCFGPEYSAEYFCICVQTQIPNAIFNLKKAPVNTPMDGWMEIDGYIGFDNGSKL